MPRISVVVITYNRCGLVGDCLDSLQGQDLDAPFEVVVVDDGSTDRTAEVVAERAKRPGAPVRYIHQLNGGVNAARNRGIAEADGEIILLFDDDQLAPPGYLARVVARLDADPTLDGVGGPCLDTNEGVRTCPTCSLASVDVPGEGVRLVPRLLGGNMAVRADVFARVGPFEATLSGRGDDNEWFYRAAGCRFLQDPELWVWHRRDHFSLAGLCLQAFRQGQTIPKSAALQGATYQTNWPRLGRSLGHAVRRRCAKGLWLAARDLGALYGRRRLTTRLVPPATEHASL